jgi:glutathione S-transferase
VPPRVLLYGYDLSHYAVAAERMLAFKRVPHRRVPVPYHDKRGLIAATGQDYIPALLWDGRFVVWSDLADFLERSVPEPALYPAGDRGLARVLENWGHQVIEERVWKLVVGRMGATLPDPVERWVFEEIQTRSRGSLELMDRRRAEFRRDLAAYLTMIEDLLRDRSWILGEPSLADFGIYGSLAPLARVGERIPAKYRGVRAWLDRVRSIPSAETSRGPVAVRRSGGPARSRGRPSAPTKRRVR